MSSRTENLRDLMLLVNSRNVVCVLPNQDSTDGVLGMAICQKSAISLQYKEDTACNQHQVIFRLVVVYMT